MKLLPIVMLALGVAGGFGAGVLMPDEDATCPETPPDVLDGERANCPPSDTEADPEDAGDAAVEFVRMNDQFVIPVLSNGQVRSLVVLSLTLEVRAGASPSVFDLEPKLRDTFLGVLFDHANSGGFDGAFTSGQSIERLRAALLEAARKTAGPVVGNVLILDILRQDA